MPVCCALWIQRGCDRFLYAYDAARITNDPGIKKQVKAKGYNFTYAYDESQKTGKAYGAGVTPTVIVLDKARNVRYMGALDNSTMNETKVTKSYVKDAVTALLAGKDVEVTETRPQGCGISYSSSK